MNAIKEEHDRLTALVEQQEMESRVRLLQALLGQRLMESEGYITDAQIAQERGWGARRMVYQSDGYDHRDGHFRGVYESEPDHQRIRAASRWLAVFDDMVKGILRNLRVYAIGQGSELQVMPKVRGESAQQVAAVSAFLSEFDEVNQLPDDGEAEALHHLVVDGDFLWGLQPRGRAVPKLWYVTGELISEPPNARAIEDYYGSGLVGLDWRYGIATPHGQPDEPHAFFVDWNGDGTEWDVLPAELAVWRKRNVPRRAKRGLPDLFAPNDRIRRGAKLFDNAVIGATIQASIAYIKSAAAGQTPANLTAALEGRLSRTATAMQGNGRGQSVTVEDVLGGKIINASGFGYQYGPMGTPQGPLFVDTVYQAVARRIGAVWGMPEYMISGDASNANYASTLVAESPFVRGVLHEQAVLSRARVELAWKAIDCVARHGRFGGTASTELRQMLTIDYRYQSPETRNAVEAETVMDRQQAAGVLSRKTRAAKSNLDFAEELANGAVVAVPALPAAISQKPVAEQRIESLRFSLIEGKS